jgi:hypothetical protein
MKRVCGKLNRKLWAVALFALVLSLIFSLAACSTDNEQNPENYLTVSGQITLGGAPLANVTVLKNGEDFLPAVFTNSHGIFLATGLKNGDVLSFIRHGYTFSPAEHLVLSDEYDLRVTAHAASGGDDNGGGDQLQTFSVEITSDYPDLVDAQGGTFEDGTQIPLCAREQDGLKFLGWFIDGELFSSLTDCCYTLLQNASVEARFVEVPLAPHLEWSVQTLTLCWQAVSGAASYNIHIDGELFAQTENLCVSLDRALSDGEHQIAVEAVGNEEFSGGISHPAQLTIDVKPRVLGAKNIGFLQNYDGKFLIFELGSDADGFSLKIIKNNIEWGADALLCDILEYPQSSELTLSLVPQAAEEFNLNLFASFVERQENGEDLTVVAVQFDGLFGADGLIAEILNRGGTPDFPEPLSGLKLTGAYQFQVTALTSDENFRDSAAESIEFEHEVRLPTPASLVFSDGTLTFAIDLNSIGAQVDDLFFELFVNNVKIAEVSADECELSPDLQSPTADHSLTLSSYFSGDLGDVTSLSLIASAPDFLCSLSATIEIN